MKIEKPKKDSNDSAWMSYFAQKCELLEAQNCELKQELKRKEKIIDLIIKRKK